MPHDVSLIATITMGLVLAFFGGLVAHRLRLPPLVGYLLAGVALGPFTPGLCRGRQSREPARRNRRHSPDVRRGPAFLDQGPAGGARHRAARRHCADRGCHGERRGARASVGLGRRRRPGAGIGPVGREHRSAAACAGAAQRARYGQRPYRGRVADRRGPRDGARSRSASGARGRSRWRCPWHRRPVRGRQRGHCVGSHHRQGGAVRGARFSGRNAGRAVAAPAGRAHRLARAVHAFGAGDCARHCLRLGRAVRRVVCAGRILRRRRAQRIRLQPSGSGRLAALAGCVRRAVLRIGRHAVRSRHPGASAAGGAGRRDAHRAR